MFMFLSTGSFLSDSDSNLLDIVLDATPAVTDLWCEALVVSYEPQTLAKVISVCLAVWPKRAKFDLYVQLRLIGHVDWWNGAALRLIPANLWRARTLIAARKAIFVTSNSDMFPEIRICPTIARTTEQIRDSNDWSLRHCHTERLGIIQRSNALADRTGCVQA